MSFRTNPAAKFFNSKVVCSITLEKSCEPLHIKSYVVLHGFYLLFIKPVRELERFVE